MGIQDRDYYREGSGRFLDAWGRQGATIWLIVVTCVVFFVQCLGGDPSKSPLVEDGAYSYGAIVSGEFWRLFTSMFLHAGLLHLALNMLVLYWAGTILEDIYGAREFATFYVLGGLFANGLKLAIHGANLAPPTPSFGASTAVTATLVLFAFHFPWQRVYIWFVLPMPVWLLVVIFVALDGLGALGVGQAGIGYLGHLGGALFGALYYQTGIRFGDLFTRRPRPTRRVRPQLRVISPAQLDDTDTPEPVGAAVENRPRPREGSDDIESKVDAVLAKVSKLGQESLTPEEREILFKASELYKKKRK
jgi:membrane associated rhomboid family serine protease